MSKLKKTDLEAREEFQQLFKEFLQTIFTKIKAHSKCLFLLTCLNGVLLLIAYLHWLFYIIL